MRPEDRVFPARLALTEAGVIAQEAIELVARHPERAAQIVDEARRLIARRNVGR